MLFKSKANMIVGNSTKSPQEVLRGRLFISTRPKSLSDGLKKYFGSAGAELLEMPMIEIKPADISETGRNTLEKAGTFDWIIFTSGNGVRYFMEEYRNIAGSYELPPGVSIASIGSKTAKIAEEYGIEPRFISRRSNAAGFADELSALFSGSHPRVLWPTGKLSPGIFTGKLSLFSDINRINLYHTVMPETIIQPVLRHIINDTYNIIFFFSPSAVKNFLSATRGTGVDNESLRVACIGTVTRKACLDSNIIPLFTAGKPDSESLFKSTTEYYRSKEN